MKSVPTDTDPVESMLRRWQPATLTLCAWLVLQTLGVRVKGPQHGCAPVRRKLDCRSPLAAPGCSVPL
eukprot:16705-Chlamydomonas_euryale.AAC.2